VNGRALLAGDRQLQHGSHNTALFLIVWGGMFGGIPLAIFFAGGATDGGGKLALLLFPLLGFSAFFWGLYIVLKRREIWFDPLFDRIEVRESVLGRAETPMVAKKQFDRVHLRTEVGKEDSRSYKIALLGPGADELELGEFSDRNEALIAGMRAARRAGLAFEEKPEGLMLLRLEAAEPPVARLTSLGGGTRSSASRRAFLPGARSGRRPAACP
jgi:hypothetical protein